MTSTTEKTTMALESGDVITREILSKALANQFDLSQSQIVINNFELSAGSKVGESYATDIKRINGKAVVDGLEKSFDYIAKVKPATKAGQEIMAKTTIFECECAFYESVSKMANQLRDSKGLPQLKFCRSFVQDMKGILIMENLKQSGFQATEKSLRGLSSEEIEMGLARLASFHATMYHLVETYHGGKEKLFEDHPWFKFKTFFQVMGEDQLDLVEGWYRPVLMQVGECLISGGRPDLAERLKANTNGWLNKGMASGTPRPESLRTLMHGDYWYSNMMFNYVNNTLKDCAMIDFQVMNYGFPGPDLVYFLHSSAHPSMRKLHLSNWLKLYHDVLQKELTVFGYPDLNYNLEEVKKDYHHSSYFGFLMELMHTQNLLTRPDTEVGQEVAKAFQDNESFDDFTEKLASITKFIVKAALSTSGYMERIVLTLEQAIDDGVLK